MALFIFREVQRNILQQKISPAPNVIIELISEFNWNNITISDVHKQLTCPTLASSDQLKHFYRTTKISSLVIFYFYCFYFSCLFDARRENVIALHLLPHLFFLGWCWFHLHLLQRAICEPVWSRIVSDSFTYCECLVLHYW